jgi:glycosyltransferase involved in cell wall biosynthesis
MDGLSICLVVQNEAKQLKLCLESLKQQDTDKQVEICIGDLCSTDDLYYVLDDYSDVFTFKYVHILPSNYMFRPPRYRIKEINTIIYALPTFDNVVLLSPYVVLLDRTILQDLYTPYEVYSSAHDEISLCRIFRVPDEDNYSSVEEVRETFYNAYLTEDFLDSYVDMMDCSSFSRKTFVELGGFNPAMAVGCGSINESFGSKNLYEIDGISFLQARPSPTYADLEINKRVSKLAPKPRFLPRLEKLSLVYTIKEGQIVNSERVGLEREVNLPFLRENTCTNEC